MWKEASISWTMLISFPDPIIRSIALQDLLVRCNLLLKKSWKECFEISGTIDICTEPQEFVQDRNSCWNIGFEDFTQRWKHFFACHKSTEERLKNVHVFVVLLIYSQLVDIQGDYGQIWNIRGVTWRLLTPSMCTHGSHIPNVQS